MITRAKLLSYKFGRNVPSSFSQKKKKYNKYFNSIVISVAAVLNFWDLDISQNKAPQRQVNLNIINWYLLSKVHV